MPDLELLALLATILAGFTAWLTAVVQGGTWAFSLLKKVHNTG